MTDTTEGFAWGIISSENDPERWKMEMLEAALDGLDTLQRLLEAKHPDALEKLFQVRGDLTELFYVMARHNEARN